MKVIRGSELRALMAEWRREGLSPDTWTEPDIVIDGVRLTPKQAEFVRGAVEGADAVGVIAPPSVRRPVRDLVRGVNAGNRFERAPARAANVISFPSATPLR